MAAASDRPPLIGVTTSEVRRAERTVPTPEGEPPQHEMALGMPYVRALARAGAIPIVLPPLRTDVVAGAARAAGRASACPAARISTRPPTAPRRTPELGPDRAGAGRVRARGRAPRRRRRPADPRHLPRRPGAQRRARRHAVPAPAGGHRRHGRATARPRRAGRTTHDVARRGRLAARRASWARETLRVNSFHHQAVDRLGRRPARRRVGARRDGRGDRGRRRAASCSASSGTPRRSTGGARSTRGCSRRSSPPLRDARLDPAGLSRVRLRRRAAPGRPAGPRRARAHGRVAGPARAGRRRPVDRRRRRDGPPAAGDHRPRPSWARSRCATTRSADHRLQRLHLQPPRAARRAAGARPLVRLDERHRGAAEGLARVGRGPARPTCTGMFAFACSTSDAGASCSSATGSGSSRSTSREARRRRCAPRRRCPALLAGGGVDTRVDPVALHHYLCWHSVVPGAADDPARRPQAPAGDGAGRRARRPRAASASTGTRRSSARGCDVDDWPDALREALRVAVRRRMVADVPVGILSPAAWTRRLIVALLAEQGQRGLATFSIGFEDAGGRAGDEFEFSDLVAREFGTDHHQLRIDRRAAVDALPQAIDAMSEPMVSHDCVAFWLLTRGGARASARSCSPARAPTRCSAATTGTRRCSRRPARARRLRGGVLRPRRRRRARAAGRRARRRRLAARSRAGGSTRAGRRPRRSTARCGWTPRSCSSTTRSSAWTT